MGMLNIYRKRAWNRKLNDVQKEIIQDAVQEERQKEEDKRDQISRLRQHIHQRRTANNGVNGD